MSHLTPIATYNLNLQPFQPAAAIELEYPSSIRLTSVAIDPESVDEEAKPSTLRMLKRKLPFIDEDYDSEGDDEEDLDEDELDVDEEDEEEEKEEEEEEEEKEENDEDDDSEDDDEEDELDNTEEYVICTLGPSFQYQQVVDITIQPDEEVYFIVTGSYPIHLTGNYVDHPDDEDSQDEYDSEDEDDVYGDYDEDEFDLTPDEEEIYDLEDLEGESDIENKIEELVEEDNKKRSLEQDAKPSKKAKKDKKNVQFTPELEQGPSGSEFEKKAKKDEKKVDKKVEKKEEKKEEKKVEKKDKKVEKKEDKKAEKAEKEDAKFPTKTLLGGVITEDRKVGKGQTAKTGNRVSIRYIGKLKNGKVFDKNTGGKPFSFGLGKGECIKGFDLGVAGMAVGGERRVIIPAKMGYGSQALPGIPANSELTFDIKLVSLK